MRTTFLWTAVLLGLAMATASQADAAIFVDEDFEYTNDAAMAAAGWVSQDTAAVTETGGEWKLGVGDHSTLAAYNPPTTDGSPSTGKFVCSNSSAAGGVSNLPDTGASHDLYTPEFSTVGSKKVWFHADVSAYLNNEGEAVFLVDVSNNGGSTWNTVLTRVCPDRGQPGYRDPMPQPVLTYVPDNTNADGYHGRLDLNLSSYAANKSDVQVRIRHYEPWDDWWIKLDNVLIDDQPVVHGNTTVFTEDFNHPADEPDRHWVGNMTTDGDHEDGLTWVTWGTGGVESGPTTVADFGWYVPTEYTDPNTGLHWRTLGGQTRQVNRLEHTPRSAGDPNPNPNPDFAIIDCNYRSSFSEYADEYMMTPVLDLSELDDVFLGYEDEIWYHYNTHENAVTYEAVEVLLMRDDDANGPDRDDQVIKTIFSYDPDSMGPPDPVTGEDPWYANRLFAVPEAAGHTDYFFSWHYEGVNCSFWAIDSIKVSGNISHIPGDANGDAKVDDQDAAILAGNWQKQSGALWTEGDFNSDGKVNDQDAAILAGNWHYGTEESGSVPEPSTLAMLLGAAAMAWLGYRRRR